MRTTRKEMIKRGNSVYGRGYYKVEVYENFDPKYNKEFKNYMSAYNYCSELIKKDIWCGFTIYEFDENGDLICRGDIGC